MAALPALLVLVSTLAQSQDLPPAAANPEAASPSCVGSITSYPNAPAVYQIVPDSSVPAGIANAAASAWDSPSIQPAECQEANSLNITPAELPPPSPPPVQCPINCVNGCLISNVCACPADCPDSCDANGICKAGGGDDCQTNPDECQPQDDGGLLGSPIPPAWWRRCR